MAQLSVKTYDKAHIKGRCFYHLLYQSPMGACVVFLDAALNEVAEISLAALGFVGAGKNACAVRDDLAAQFAGADIKPCPENLKKSAEKKLAAAFKGGRIGVSLFGTEFQHKVWRRLLKLRHGKTDTYKGVGKHIGRHARPVGQAIGRNQIAWFVPCHRVLNSAGKLHGYRWGLDIKRKLLENENAL